MKVLNSSRNTILTENILFADSLWKKAKGLLGIKKPSSMFFKTQGGIYTIGMRFALDCVVCDDDFKIVTIKENLLPNRVFFWNPRYRNIFEFPAGTISQTQTQVGDILQLVDLYTNKV